MNKRREDVEEMRTKNKNSNKIDMQFKRRKMINKINKKSLIRKIEK